MKKIRVFTAAITTALISNAALAIENRTVFGPEGNVVFDVRFFDMGEGPFMPGDGPDEPPASSTWTLNANQKDKIEAAIQYWAELITPTPGQLPVVINVGTFEDENAAGDAGHLVDGAASVTTIQAALQGKDPGPLDFGAHAFFVMGRLDFDDLDYLPSQLPRPEGEIDVYSVAFHELAHGLGIASSIEAVDDDEERPIFGSSLGSYSQLLRDDNGNPGRPGQLVICSECTNAADPDAFDVRKDQGYLTGAHIEEVLAGAMPGVPVRMLGESGEDLDNNYMSHLELKNSLMSHQSYRNYTTFMEAELAVLQDMGYTIDRRNFYGYSVYGDGQTIFNNHGYSKRNAQGTAYVPGYNTATLGLGLHIYGSRNTLYQQADLLTQGAGAAGIRVDGQANTVVVDPGTRVHAQGVNGRGVMFAYGKDHNLVQRGDVQALGPGGIAASFDFGNNLMGDREPFGQYRGSYIFREGGDPLTPLPDELNGALVNQFDLTGQLAGSTAAIYISRNALVERINIMRGARVQGDIVSEYGEDDGEGNPRLTRLSFGQLPDDTGVATGKADDQFFFRHEGDIQGGNLALTAQGGYTSLNGEHDIYSMTVDKGAVVGGNSRYTIDASQAFVNNGTLAPGNSLGTITVDGNFQQGPDGKLLMEIDGAGGHDILAVTGQAQLGGALALAPVSDWYAPGWSLDFNELLQADATAGAFDDIRAEISSPTLRFQVTQRDGNDYTVTATRSANAYSQYASDDNTVRTGRMLDQLLSSARNDVQPLYQGLDFSSPDGSDIANALAQLSPAAYSAMVASSLSREQQIGDVVSARRNVNTTGTVTDEWTGFAIPFGSGTWQDRRGSMVPYDASSYGVVFGAEKRSAGNRDLILGMHGAVSGQSVKTQSPYDAEGKSTAFSIGLQARYEPDSARGLYMFGQGRVGVEDGKMDRHIRVGDYAAKNESDWTGFNGTLMAGAGYRWVVSRALSIGPVATLDYTAISRPGLSESGPDATRLKLASEDFNSLRSSIGLSGSLDLTQQGTSTLKASMQVTWDRELLDNKLVQDAHFVGYRDAGFSSSNQVAGRDALGARIGLRYQREEDLVLGADVSSQFFRAGHRSVSGSLSVTWRF